MITTERDVDCAICGVELIKECEHGCECGLWIYLKDDDAFTFRVARTCNRPQCLKKLLEKLLCDEPRAVTLFNKINEGPGGWPGPNGCVHYLNHGDQKQVAGWLEYAYRVSEFPKEQRAIWASIPEECERIKARARCLSVVGHYGDLVDGCWHFCSYVCALGSFFPYSYPLPERWLGDILSHSGLPDILDIED